MAEISIDHSKLPGVKEVCRDFAVLEDHTLAHNLQEQEIEHHLATNIQRNRLVQHDLQMAKQLQEEEDRKALARIQGRHKDLEWQDNEMAQEIQVKLVIEAEQRRRQEEDDEDIARLLQQKELQEGKRRKKPHPEPLPRDPYEEGYYPDSRDRPCGSPREQASEHAGPRPPRSGDSELPRERRRGPPFVSEGLDLEVSGSSSEMRKARGGWRHNRERKEGSQEKLQKLPLDQDDAYVERGSGGSRAQREREPASQERSQASSLLILDEEAERAGGGHRGSREHRERRPRSRERNPRPCPLILDLESGGALVDHSSGYHKPPSSEKSLRPPSRNVDVEESLSDWRYGNSHSPNADGLRLPLEDRQSPRASRDLGLQDLEAPHPQGRRKAAERELTGMGQRARASPQHGEEWETDPGSRRSPGMKSRGTKEAIYQKPRPIVQDPEFYDAEIARKLQEEELLASHVDKRAAQVAQDEEIARLLMAEEKKAYKKAKEREKGSSDKKRRDQDWKHDTHKLVHPRSRECHEPHRPRSNKPTRPPPPSAEDLDHPPSFTSQHNPAHQIPKPEPSHKGYHYKQ